MVRYTHPNLPNFLSPAPFKLGKGDEAISYAYGWWGKTTAQKIKSLGFVPYVPPPAPDPLPQPPAPHLYAAAAICITGGAISVIEQAAQLQSATYDDGWVMIGFTEPQDTADYLIFAQTDVPTKIEQFKEPGYFELVFSDPVTGASIEPGRMDIQILKVR